EQGLELKQVVHDLIERYARDEFASEADFNEEKKRIMTEAVQQGLTKDHIGKGLLYTDNLLQIAQNVKAMVTHRRAAGEDTDAAKVLENADIILGEAKLGARTEMRQTKTERLTSKLTKIPWVNEETV